MIAPARIQQSQNGEQQRQQREREQERFLEMLPRIRRQARVAFRWQGPEQREEMIAEVVATAYGMFVRLIRGGKENVVYATPLATYAIRRVLAGRQVATKPNARDVMSPHARAVYGIVVERLDVFDEQQGEWRAMLVEDRRATPADTAAARIDITTWLGLLSARNRQVAMELATGETACEVARRFCVSPGRISQIRRWLEASWERFQTDGGNRRDRQIVTVTC